MYTQNAQKRRGKKKPCGVFLWKFQTIKRPFCIILHLDIYFSFHSISSNSAEKLSLCSQFDDF